ncbi:MAG: phosphoribosylglycinamide formyltransferase [Candidatus Hodarchaeota archaeon]
MRIGVLASGSGSNLQSIIDSCISGYIPDSQVVLVLSNKQNAFALERAKSHNIEARFLNPPDGFLKFKRGMNIEDIMNDPLRRKYDQQIIDEFKKKEVDVVCLAGYLLFVTPKFLDEFPNAVINIHPAVLPSFKGQHGIRDAWEYGVKVIGCTTHFVDDKEDHGPIILQVSSVVLPHETSESLSKRNLKREHLIYPETLRLYQKGSLKVNGRKVEIKWDEAHFNFHQQLLELWRNDIDDYYNSRQQK